MPSRYICSVFDEMRTCIRTLNFSYLQGLIEEAQVMANRMETALEIRGSIEYQEKRLRELKAFKRELKTEIEKLKEEKCAHNMSGNV